LLTDLILIAQVEGNLEKNVARIIGANPADVYISMNVIRLVLARYGRKSVYGKKTLPPGGFGQPNTHLPLLVML